MDLQHYFTIWNTYLERQKWQTAKVNAQHNSNVAGLRIAEEKLTVLPEIPVKDALEANAKLISMLSTQRWIAMKDARDQGLSLEQIGNSLGITRQSAWEFMQRKIAEYK